MNRLSRASLVLAMASTGFAQQTITTFLVTGSLDSCAVTNATEYNSGGSIRVNQFNINVPKNLIVAFPTVFSPFSELCGAGANGFETTVVGNIVNGQIIAGQVSVAQRFALEASAGYIEAINTDGTLKIVNGPIIRLNDIEGLFGPKVDSTHKHWVVDTESPSVTAFSGFPMCIPYSGNTDKCIQSNRGAGQAFRPADPLRMVPFAVGDFIEYSGLPIGDNEMLVSDIVCTSLHITTTASAIEPNYIRIEAFLVGVADTAPNVEVADIRAVGYLSSCAGSNVVISAIDVDPCTGEETYREIASGAPKQETRCRFDIRVTSPSRAPFTREYRITTNGAVIRTKDGIEAGQYVTPVTEWIFPEVATPGTFPPPYPFTDIQGLVQGDFLDGKQFPSLSPFPGATPPAPSKTCSPSDIPDPNAPSDPNATPVAFAQQFSATARVGTQVELSASNNNTAISTAHISYKWKQISPTTPIATLSNNKTSKPTFLAPKISAQTNFKFNVTICNTGNSTTPINNANQKCSTASTSLTISPSTADAVTIDRYTWASRQSGTIDVQCTSNVKNGDNKGMTLLLNGSTRLTMTKGSNDGVWLYGSRSVSRPTTLKCVSDLGGESVQKAGTDTTARKREVFRA